MCASPDAVINISTGGSQVMSLDERFAAPLRAAPERKVLHLKGADNVGF